MRFFINLTDGAVTQSVSDRSHQASGWVTKRGQRAPAEIQYHRDGTPEKLADGVPMLLGLKLDKTFDGPYLASVASFTVPTDPTGFYRGKLPTSSEPINTALGSPDDAVGNDFAAIPATTCEIQWWPDGPTEPPTKSQTFSVRIENTPNNGNEPEPGTTTPYPAPGAVATKGYVDQVANDLTGTSVQQGSDAAVNNLNIAGRLALADTILSVGGEDQQSTVCVTDENGYIRPVLLLPGQYLRRKNDGSGYEGDELTNLPPPPDQVYSGTGGNLSIATPAAGNVVRVRLASTLTANLNIILPSASAVREVRVEDPSGFSSAAISVYAIHQGSDTLNGSAGYTKILSGAGAATLYSAAGGKWLFGTSYVAAPGVLYLRGNGAAVDISSSGGNSYLHGWNTVDTSSRLLWDQQGYISFFGPGQARFNNWATTDFAGLTFGPSTAAGRSMQFAGTLTRFRSGDNSADAPISASAITLNPVITPAGTTGNRTINASAGTIRIAAGQVGVSIANSLVTTATKVRSATVQTADSTAKSASVFISVAGYLNVQLNAAAAGEVEVYWELAN